MEIPAYPGFRPLEITDKAMFDEYFCQLQPNVSEFTFANLFLFRKAHNYRLTRVGNSAVVMGNGYDAKEYFLAPLGGNVAAALAALFGAGLTLYGADGAFMSAYLNGTDLNISEDRDSFDYLYRREDLAMLPGNRFHKKRNRISYFEARHEYMAEQFAPHHLEGCLELLSLWKKTASVDGDSMSELEGDAAKEALQTMEILGLEGMVISVGGVVKAFALGERLNSRTAVCHFEKTYPFMEGLSQLVNREFSARLFTDCRFINREQDLGLTGLRNAKLSYHPVELVKKYRVSCGHENE